MNDDRLLLEMRRWLQEEQVALPDPEEAGRQIASQLPNTRQRRRRWRVPSRASTARPPEARETAAYQPSPIPATNGHTPIVIGRTTSMLTPAKAIAAGAVVALAAGFLAQAVLDPTSAPETVPGAAAVSPSPSAVTSEGVPLQEHEFAGKLRIEGGISSDVPGVIRYRYLVDEMSDPRLEGDWILDYTQATVDFGPTARFLYHASFRMVDEDGAWQEEPNLTLELPDGTATSRTSALVGEGAYEGLTAVAELTYIPQGRFDIHGVVTDRPIPVAPDEVETDQ